MTIFLILAPFGSFALLMLVTSRRDRLFAVGGDLPRRDRVSTSRAAARSRCSAPASVVVFSARRRLRQR